MGALHYTTNGLGLTACGALDRLRHLDGRAGAGHQLPGECLDAAAAGGLPWWLRLREPWDCELLCWQAINAAMAAAWDSDRTVKSAVHRCVPVEPR